MAVFVIVLSVFNFFQTFGYYGFAAWVSTLLIAKGITITTSLLYSFVIAIANPGDRCWVLSWRIRWSGSGRSAAAPSA